MAKRVLARRSLIAFTKRFYPQYQVGWVHEDIARRLEAFSKAIVEKKSPRLMILVPPRHGKALAVGTLVPTPVGFRKIEELQPGDFVFGRDGQPTRVVAVSPVWRDRELYEVTSDDGASVVVDAEHEWTVRLCRKRPSYKPKTTKWLAERKSPRAPALMTYSAVEHPEVDLPVDPYVLGVWLGDGCSHHATITEGAQDYDFIRTEVEKSGVLTTDRGTALTFGLLDVWADIKKLGLVDNKHIPEIYARASRRQRLALLQGLIDTDGYVGPEGQIELCLVNQTLALQAQALVRSLGVKASLNVGRATINGQDFGLKYRVMFYMADAARLPRKAAKCRNNQRTPHRFLAFKPAGRGDTICIQVEAADHQYLVGDGYLLTHNSELASIRFPAWHLGHNPDHEIINCGYNLDLPMRFSRKVREILRDPGYKPLFPSTALDPESQSTEAWLTTMGGGFTAAGVGGGITGKGAHCAIVDDPIKNQEEADSILTREGLWDWYWSTLYTRLAPGGGVLVIQCMVGDTPVLMADGTERRLDLLRVGDQIATYDRGELGTSTVAKIKSNGRDVVYKITTTSGKIVRANGRHPFLVAVDGKLKWVRTRSLTTAQKIVVVKGSGVSGEALPVQPTAVTNRQSAEDSARLTTLSRSGLTGIDRPAQILCPDEKLTSSTDTGSHSLSTKSFSKLRAASVRSAESPQAKGYPTTGRTNSPSITATTQGASEGYCATTVTLESDILELSPWHLPQPGTSDFILDGIASVVPDGEEEVFDVQVDRTENFIANGLVSHNTWWHDDDLAGRLQQLMLSNPEADQFTIVKYPMEAEFDEYLDPTGELVRFDPEGEDQPEPTMRLLRRKGEPLHPERYDKKMMLSIKANQPPRVWSALYQQNPVPDEGAYFKKEYFRYEPVPPAAYNRNVYQAWDFAIGEKQVHDYTVGVTAIQDENDYLHVVEVVRFRGDSFVIVEEILNAVQRWGSERSSPLTLGFEDSQIWKAIKPLLEKRMSERGVYPPYEVMKPLTDKLARARPLQGRMQQGRVYFPKDATWLNDAQTELLRFPAGAHDDIVDALAWLVHLCVGKTPKHMPKPKKIESWRDKLKNLTSVRGGSHMTA